MNKSYLKNLEYHNPTFCQYSVRIDKNKINKNKSSGILKLAFDKKWIFNRNGVKLDEDTWLIVRLGQIRLLGC